MVLNGTRVLVTVLYQPLQGDGMESRVMYIVRARAIVRHVSHAFVPWLAGKAQLVKSEVSDFGTTLDQELQDTPDFKEWAIMSVTYENEVAPHIRVQQLAAK